MFPKTFVPKTGDIEAKREFFRQAQAKASAGDAESMFFIAMDYGAGGELKTDLAKSAFGCARQPGNGCSVHLKPMRSDTRPLITIKL